jgi:hypothetical protein
MKTITLNIEVTEQEFAALVKEYERKGLGISLEKFPGNKPTPLDMVIKKLVEAREATK